MIYRVIPILLALAILLAACGSEAPPTLSVEDVQSTAIAAAWTMVAATQQAIPTTAIPPTETPSLTPPPTFTPFATLALSTQSTLTPVVQAAGTDNCLHPLNMGEAGPMKRVRIENESGGTSVNLSLNLWQPNLFGQCGALSWSGKPGYWKEIVEIPSGSWYAHAWITFKNGQSGTAETSFIIGPSKSDDLLRLVIKKEIISWVGP